MGLTINDIESETTCGDEAPSARHGGPESRVQSGAVTDGAAVVIRVCQHVGASPTTRVWASGGIGRR